ncbi:MAG: hypothetical protein MUO31_10150, partial [Thermodesulfovibrionales bacterium]|nr:hypothetical protein [Thermodesulfovibrionales bacterium]
KGIVNYTILIHPQSNIACPVTQHLQKGTVIVFNAGIVRITVTFTAAHSPTPNLQKSTIML